VDTEPVRAAVFDALELATSIDFLPDGSVWVWTREGELLFPAGSFEADQYRGMLGHLAPSRTASHEKTTIVGRILDIDHAGHVVRME